MFWIYMLLILVLVISLLALKEVNVVLETLKKPKLPDRTSEQVAYDKAFAYLERAESMFNELSRTLVTHLRIAKLRLDQEQDPVVALQFLLRQLTVLSQLQGRENEEIVRGAKRLAVAIKRQQNEVELARLLATVDDAFEKVSEPEAEVVELKPRGGFNPFVRTNTS